MSFMTTVLPILLLGSTVLGLTAAIVKILLGRGRSGWAIGVLVAGLGAEIVVIQKFLAALETATQIQ